MVMQLPPVPWPGQDKSENHTNYTQKPAREVGLSGTGWGDQGNGGGGSAPFSKQAV